MSKSIPYRKMVSIEGRPVRVPKRDEDGELIWIDVCPVCERPSEGAEPEREAMDTYSAIRTLCFSIIPSIRRNDDPRFASRVMTAVERARKRDGPVRLEDGDYEWMGRLFERHFPKAKAGELAEGADATTVGEGLWGINAWVVQQQLTPKGLEEEVDGEDEDGAEAVAAVDGHLPVGAQL